MKKRILSIVLMLALAFSLAIGTAVVSSANAGDSTLALNLAENITVQVKFEGWANTAAAALVQIEERTPATVIPVKSGDDAIVEVAVPVKDLDADVTVKVYTADGDLLATKAVNAATYCEGLAEDATYGALVAALKKYSAVAKSYFAEDGTLVAPDVAPDFGEKTEKSEGTLPAGLKHDSVTLILESETTIRHYFSLEEGAKIGSYLFYVDLDCDGGYDKDEEVVPFKNGDSYCVDIAGITPNDLDEAYTITVVGDTTYSYTYGVLDYASNSYGKEDASDAIKALTAALNEYLAEAAKIGANIVYMDGETELKTELYNYGVDNFISYATEKDGFYFAGWVDADGKKVNKIAAGTTGDVTLYAEWEVAPVTPTISSEQANIITGFTDLIGSSATVTTTDGVTSIACGSFVANGNKTFGTFNNKELPVAISAAMSTAGVNYNYVKASMEFGMVEGCTNAVPITGRFAQEQSFFGIAPDGSVYLGGVPGDSFAIAPANSGDTYKIAQLKAGELTNVEFYIDLTGASLATNTKAKVVLRATNVAGEEVSLNVTQNWTGGRTGIAQWRTTNTLSSSIAGQSAGLLIGDFEWKAVPMMGEYSSSTITDATTGTMYSYESAQATRLPANVTINNKAFLGWYADEACTQPINSIEKGYMGPVTVYSKWANADRYVANKAANGNHFTDYSGYGDSIEEFDMAYTYTVLFDKSSSTATSGQTRLRPSGLEAYIDAEGNVAYRDWAKYYQYYSLDPTRAGLHNTGNMYVGDVFDGILADLGVELRAKDENGEFIMTTYKTIEKQTVTESQQKVDESGAPMFDENNEPIMEEVQVEKEVEVDKPCHQIDEVAYEYYYERINKYNPNSSNTQALLYRNGIVKTMNGKVLANVLESDAIISFVLDFADLELRYYVNGEFVAAEALKARTLDTPIDENCNVFFDADGGLSNYNSYTSAQPFGFFNWQNMANVTFVAHSLTFGDIYDNTANVSYELNGGTVDGELADEIAVGAELVLPESVSKDKHIFSGWYLDAGFETPADGYVVPNNKNITVYAKLVELVYFDITYVADGATLSDGYTASFVPGYTNVVLPSATKDGVLFVGWFMDEALTQKVTAEALAAVEADVSLYAKFVDNAVAHTAAANAMEYNNGMILANGLNLESDYLAASKDKAITLRFVLDAVEDPSSIVNSVAQFRVRDDLGASLINPIYVKNGVFYAGNDTSGKVLASNLADREVVIDIVLDFDAGKLIYYVDYEKVHTASATFSALGTGLYDYSDAPTYKSFYQWITVYGNLHHTVYTIYGDIHHLDSNGDHLCDDCNMRLTDCVDVVGDGDHKCDQCGADGASKCVDDDADLLCDECGLTMVLTGITYVANGGTLPQDGYTTEFIPGVTKVVLPNATKDGEILVNWYLDSALTQKATAEALAAVTEDVTLYAKYQTAYWTKSGTTAVTEYWYTQGDIGSDMIAAGVDTLTLRIDTANAGSVDWSGVGTNDGEPTYARLRTGTGGTEAKFLYFCDGYITTADSNRTKLVAINSGDVLNVVINFTSKTAAFYVNGEFICQTSINVNSDLTYYNYVTPAGGADKLARDNMFQLGAANGTGRKLAYDSVQILFGEVIF